ncbi:MAG: hypothetical protein V5A14_01675 [Desulfohalobiaceae bacterium]
MNRGMAIVCQLLGALIGAYGASSIMDGGAGWGSVFLGLVLIFFGSKFFMQQPAQAKKRERDREE